MARATVRIEDPGQPWLPAMLPRGPFGGYAATLTSLFFEKTLA